jgi:hypothetical protein
MAVHAADKRQLATATNRQAVSPRGVERRNDRYPTQGSSRRLLWSVTAAKATGYPFPEPETLYPALSPVKWPVVGSRIVASATQRPLAGADFIHTDVWVSMGESRTSGTSASSSSPRTRSTRPCCAKLATRP